MYVLLCTFIVDSAINIEKIIAINYYNVNSPDALILIVGVSFYSFIGRVF